MTRLLRTHVDWLVEVDHATAGVHTEIVCVRRSRVQLVGHYAVVAVVYV